MEALLAAYNSRYPQEVRELAETLCAGTTRLESPGALESRVLPADVRRAAEKHGIPLDTLSAAVADYTVIEKRAMEIYRARARPGV